MILRGIVLSVRKLFFEILFLLGGYSARNFSLNEIQHSAKFEIIENVMVISIKNHLKDGVDLDCFNILKLIYRTIGPLEES
jgi:hypothetical protein